MIQPHGEGTAAARRRCRRNGRGRVELVVVVGGSVVVVGNSVVLGATVVVATVDGASVVVSPGNGRDFRGSLQVHRRRRRRRTDCNDRNDSDEQDGYPGAVHGADHDTVPPGKKPRSEPGG